MKIDGRAIADSILNNLAQEVNKLKEGGITPTLAVIQVGDDPGSTAYIRQKQKAAEWIGAKLILSHQTSAISLQTLQNVIQQYNNDPSVHGIILQRPLPPKLANTSMYQYIEVNKDVDGFLPNSPYPVPVAAAVLRILEEVYAIEKGSEKQSSFDNWLKAQCVVVIGRGETAGKPITELLQRKYCTTSIVHSQTENPGAIIRTMPIVVSCVGKPRVITREMVTNDTILIGIGLWRDSEGKLHGDYEEDEIKDIAAYYTPTPGGVGPINVACLMANLIQAASKLL